MTLYRLTLAEEGESSVGATVGSTQIDEEAENTEQAPDTPAEEQQANFNLLCAACTSWGQCLEPAVISCQICQLVAVSEPGDAILHPALYHSLSAIR
jgi:hypothetical protein